MQRALGIKSNSSFKSLMQDKQPRGLQKSFPSPGLERRWVLSSLAVLSPSRSSSTVVKVHFPSHLPFSLKEEEERGLSTRLLLQQSPRNFQHIGLPINYNHMSILTYRKYKQLHIQLQIQDNYISIFKADGIGEGLKMGNKTVSFVEVLVSWRCCMCAILWRKQNKPMCAWYGP